MSRAREFADLTGSADAGGLTGRNMVINGAMQVAQRGTSFSTTTAQYTLDRMRRAETSLATAVITIDQSTDAPEGFSYSYKTTTSTAEGAVDSGDNYYALVYRIEAQDCQHLAYSTNAPKTLTASFWVKSSVTGTYVLSLYNNDNARAIGKTYSISTADTWEYKTLTFSGDTTDGFNNDNGIGLELYFAGGAGSDFTSGTLPSAWVDYSQANFLVGQSVNLQNTANATWQITGLQLEVGEQATPFEHRSYGDELRRCQRYYEKFTGLATYAKARESDRTRFHYHYYKVDKRTTPTVSISGTADGSSFGQNTDSSTKGFRSQCTGVSDGATPYFTGATIDAEL